MKFFIIALALIAAVAADVSELPSSEYLPPVSQEYVPPAPVEAEPAHTFGPDGYSYKNPLEARRRYRYRVRRDVSELGIPSNEYLPPLSAPVEEYNTPVQAEAEPAHTFGPDGYSYKNPVEARRRYRIRRRRDVSELGIPSTDYLPPVEQALDFPEPEPAHIFGADGYSYKTVKRRYRIRRRRDVSELGIPSDEYLPPVDQEFIAPGEVLAEPTPAHVLTADGYKYKTVKRRYRIRRRRDVSELGIPSGEYLPPVEVSQEYLPPVQAEPEPAHILTADGYSYKNPVEARRRYRIRRRRDVSELALPQNEYLPPVEQTEVLTDVPPSHTFGPDGYSYATPVNAVRRRYRFRHRRY